MPAKKRSLAEFESEFDEYRRRVEELTERLDSFQESVVGTITDVVNPISKKIRNIEGHLKDDSLSKKVQLETITTSVGILERELDNKKLRDKIEEDATEFAKDNLLPDDQDKAEFYAARGYSEGVIAFAKDMVHKKCKDMRANLLRKHHTWNRVKPLRVVQANLELFKHGTTAAKDEHILNLWNTRLTAPQLGFIRDRMVGVILDQLGKRAASDADEAATSSDTSSTSSSSSSSLRQAAACVNYVFHTSEDEDEDENEDSLL